MNSPLSSPDREKMGRVKIDYGKFPHIFSNIVDFAELPARLRLRATCRRLRVEVDAQLAAHVVFDAKDGVPKTHEGKISLIDRPELWSKATCIDLKGDGCCHPTLLSCPCLHDLTGSLVDTIKGPAPSFQYVRIFPGSIGISNACHPDFEVFTHSARATIYVVNLFPRKSSTCALPVMLIGGSKEVVINFLHDPANQHSADTYFTLTAPLHNTLYTLLFTPSEDPSTSNRWLLGGPGLTSRLFEHLIACFACHSRRVPGARTRIIDQATLRKDWFCPYGVTACESDCQDKFEARSAAYEYAVESAMTVGYILARHPSIRNINHPMKTEVAMARAFVDERKKILCHVCADKSIELSALWRGHPASALRELPNPFE